MKHPIFDAWVLREDALSYVNPVSGQQQNIMNQYSIQIGKSLEDDNPLAATDHEKMTETIERMKDT